MLPRTLEPELMEDQAQVLAYSNADFSDSNQAFIRFLTENHHGPFRKVLDLGCGTGDVNIALARRLPEVQILAVDGSSTMIDMARRKVANAGLSDRIQFHLGRLPNLNIDAGTYDVILSKDLLHHIPDPADFWYEVQRLAGPDTTIYVMDLIRPDSQETARRMVQEVTGSEAEVLQQDFYNSLLAAFTLQEIEGQIKKTRFDYQLKRLGDRHFVVKAQDR